MSSYLPYIVIGLASGSVYAIAAMGLVVTYKTSGVFNFAHGAVGMAATFVFYSLRVDLGLPTWIAGIAAVLVVGPCLGLFIDRVLLRRLVGAPSSTYLVVSVALLVALQGFFLAAYRVGIRRMAPILPTSSFRLLGVNVGWDQACVVLIAAAVGGALFLFFRTRVGVLTRAVVEEPALAQLAGINGGLLTTVSWMLGGALAALAGVLLTPELGLDAVILTLLVVQAFGAAAVGRLVNLPLTYAGALVIGVLAAVSAKFVVDYPSLQGIPSSLPFIVLFAVLVLSGRGTFVELAQAHTPRRTAALLAARPFPRRLLPLLAVGALVAPGYLSNSRLITASAVLIYVLVFSSLGLLVGLSRQVSLCHAVFVGLGASTIARLLDAGLPYPVALVLAGLAMVPLGALVAIPAIRLSGLFLALATFAFGVLAQGLLYPTAAAFGGRAVLTIDRPELFGIDFASPRAFYFLALGLVLAGVVAVELVRVTRLGRLLRVLGDSPTATHSLGVDPLGPRVLVFCLAAFLAGVTGALLGTLNTSVNAQTFNSFQSLIWVTVLVAAGPFSLGGAVIAALLLVWLPAVATSSTLIEWQPVAFGLAAILLAQSPNGLAGWADRRRWPDFARLAQVSEWRLETGRGRERMEGA
jgi:branched-subunit amino acid ABC-type transport system permease component